MMDRIYKSADHVVAYIGEATPGTQMLFEKLSQADKIFTSSKKWEDCPEPSREMVCELDKGLDRPWFNRIWVVQEVYLAKSVTIMCGSTSCSLSSMNSCCFGYRSTRCTKHVVPVSLGQKLLCGHIRSRQMHDIQNQLWFLLVRTQGFMATDERDMIFALRAMIEPKTEDFDDLVDYEQPVATALVNVAKFLLPRTKLYLFLALRHPHTKEMPSWVPNWSEIISTPDRWYLGKTPYFHSDSESEVDDESETDDETETDDEYETNQELPRGYREASYNHLNKNNEYDDYFEGTVSQGIGSEDTNGEDHFSVLSLICSRDQVYFDRGHKCNGNHEVLCVKGIQHSQISALGTPFQSEDELLWCCTAFVHLASKRNKLEEYDISDSLCHDLLPRTVANALQNFEASDLGFFLTRAGISTNNLYFAGAAFKEWNYVVLDKGEVRERDQGTFDMTALTDSLYRCRIFLDSIGNVGIAPDAAREGDVICFIRGTTSPCLLRPGGRGGWTLISGDCYISMPDGRYEWDCETISHFLEDSDGKEETFLI